MKHPHARIVFQTICLLLLTGALATRAANIIKSDTTTMNTAADWSGTAPSSASIGEFDATAQAATLANMTLGGNMTLAGLLFDATMNGPLTIANTGGYTLTNGTSGINMSAAIYDVTLNCALSLGTAANQAQTWTVPTGRTLTFNGTLTTTNALNLSLLTVNGAGTVAINAGTVETANNDAYGVVISAGTFSAPAITIQRAANAGKAWPTAASPFTASTTAGFVVSGASTAVTLGTLTVGGDGGNSPASAYINGGSTTVNGQVLAGNIKSTAGRWGVFQVNAGSFTANDTVNGFVISKNNPAGAVPVNEEVYLTGGTTTLGKIAYGSSSDTTGGSGFLLVKGGTLYVGSGGLVKASTIGSYTNNTSFYSGILGATANWSTALSNNLSGNAFTIQAADSGGMAHNITLGGVVYGAGSITKTGGGTLTLSGANTYTGTNLISAGILNAGSVDNGTTGPFGKPTTAAGSIYFVGGNLQYSAANNTDYSGRFSTAGSQPISIDVNGQAVSFGTALAGIGTTLTLADTIGSGSLALTAPNTYTGNTTVNGGTLLANNNTSSTGSGNVIVNSGGQFGGNGIVTGAVTVNSGGALAPGNNGVGTVTVGSLTLSSGSTNNFEFNSTPANDQVVVTTSGGLTLGNTASFNIYQAGSVAGWTIPGTYNLIQYTGAISGDGTDGSGNLNSDWTTASANNPHIANRLTGFTYQFGTSGGWLTLTIAATVNLGTWNVDADGNWSVAGNWTGIGTMPPGSPSDYVTFGTGTALRTVTLDAVKTVGSITMNNNNSFVISGSKTLTLDNTGHGATIYVTGGTQNAIQTPVALNDNVKANVAVGDKLTISGAVANVSGAKTLTLNGAGTTVLSAANSYGPAAGVTGTTLSGGGTLQVGNSTSLGAGDVNVTGSITLQSGAAGISLANNLAIGTGQTATVDNNTYNLALGGVISGGGSLSKINTGVLTLGGANTYAGSTAVNGGTLGISADGSLGTSPGSATPNSVVLNGGGLLASGTVTLNANRGIGIGSTSAGNTATTTALIDANSGTLAINGIVSSAGNTGVNNLTVNSIAATPGTVVLGGANTFNGTTIVNAGTLQLANPLALQNSGLSYNSGALTFGNGITAATLGGLSGSHNLPLLNNLSAGVALTVGGNGASTTYSGALSGTGASLTKAGTGQLTLTGVNTYTGSTTGNGGTLELPAGGSITTASLAGQGYLVDGGTLNVSGDAILNNVVALNESSGTVIIGGTAGVVGAGSDGGEYNITGGSFTAGAVNLPRSSSQTTAPTASAPVAAQTTSGFYVNGATANVNLGGITLGSSLGGGISSSATARLDAGSITVSGEAIVGNSTIATRWSILQVNGGTFTASDTVNGIVIGPNSGGIVNVAELYLSGGTTTAGRIAFGASSDTAGGTGWLFVNGGSSLYVGSGGIVLPNTQGYTATVELTSGTLGATADWSSSLPMNLNGTALTIAAADASGVAHNITLSGILSGSATSALTKAGNGTLTLSAANTYGGATIISSGTLALTGSGSLASSLISMGSNTTFDVTGLSSAFTLGSSQTLSNSASATGIIKGSVATSSGSTVALSFVAGTPALTVASGTLTLDPATMVKVNNTGASLAGGSYKLISSTGGTVVASGAMPAVTVTGTPGALATLSISGGELYMRVNHAPVANSFTLAASIGTPVTVSVVPKFATDQDGDALTLTIASAPTNTAGSAVVDATGSNITYTVTSASSGPGDSFTYTATDAYGAATTGTVTVIINQTGQSYNMLTAPALNNGKVTMSFLGIPGYKYALDWTQSLTPPVVWAPLITNTAAANGIMLFTNTPSLGTDFYRTRYTP
jgi:autotransporter-associated beta strand protein